jgi:hypothetical protein
MRCVKPQSKHRATRAHSCNDPVCVCARVETAALGAVRVRGGGSSRTVVIKVKTSLHQRVDERRFDLTPVKPNCKESSGTSPFGPNVSSECRDRPRETAWRARPS